MRSMCDARVCLHPCLEVLPRFVSAARPAARLGALGPLLAMSDALGADPVMRTEVHVSVMVIFRVWYIQVRLTRRGTAMRCFNEYIEMHAPCIMHITYVMRFCKIHHTDTLYSSGLTATTCPSGPRRTHPSCLLGVILQQHAKMVMRRAHTYLCNR